jgi:tetratricopeptide (TPR) repeat protein
MEVVCSGCQRKYKLPDGYQGDVMCPKCQRKFHVGKVPVTPADRSRLVLTAIASLIAADGNPSEKEKEYLNSLATNLNAKEVQLNPDDLATFGRLAELSIKERHIIFDWLVGAVAVDGAISEAEKRQLINLSAKLKIDLSVCMQKIENPRIVAPPAPAAAAAPSPAATPPKGAGIIKNEGQRPATADEVEASRRRLAVKRVHEFTPAHALGLKPGDHLLTYDAKPMSVLSEFGAARFRAMSNVSAHLEFLRVKDMTVLEVDMAPVFLGCELEETVDSLADAYRSNPNDFERSIYYLKKLYATDQFAVCREVAETVRRSQPESPALLFLGACLIEEGEEPTLVEEYLEKYSLRWTTDYMAIGLYALGRAAERRQDRVKAQDFYKKAIDTDSDFEKPCLGLARITGVAPGAFRAEKHSAWIGQSFPTEYDLDCHPALDRLKTPQSYHVALQSLRPGSFLCLIVLGSYRGCGPCDVETKNVANIAKHFPNVVPAVHLVTESDQPERPGWCEGERWFRYSGLNFHVLYDPEQTLSFSLELAGSPFLLFVNHQGLIEYAGYELTDEVYWRLVNGPR